MHKIPHLLHGLARPSFRDAVLSEGFITGLYSSSLPPSKLDAMHQCTKAPTALFLQPNASQKAMCGRGFCFAI